MSVRGSPGGRQRADELLAFATAFFRNNSAASGRIGFASRGKSTRMSRKYFENELGSSPGSMKAFTPAPKRRSFSSGESYAVRHTPERSGLPFAARGVFADKLGLPSAPRGVRGVG